MCMQVVSAFFTTRKEWYCREGKNKDVTHPCFFVSAYFSSKRSVPFRQKVRTFLGKSTLLL